MRGLLPFLGSRLLRALVALWLVSTVVFVVMRLSGDPVPLLLPPDAPRSEIFRVRAELGLDRPLPVQYLVFLGNALRGDFGRSIHFREPAARVVRRPQPAVRHSAADQAPAAARQTVSDPANVFGGQAAALPLHVAATSQGPLDVQISETSRGGALRGGAEYRVDVTLKPGAPSGAISEPITLKTNDPTNPLIHVGVTGTIAAPLELSPNKVRMEAKVGEFATQRVLVRAAKPFKVVGVDGAADGISVELPATAAALPVQVITLKFEPKQPGIAARELRVRTDLDGGSATLAVEVEGTK